MIVPSGCKLVLDPLDEYMHVPEVISNYNESMYFNALDHTQGVGVWMRIDPSTSVFRGRTEQHTGATGTISFGDTNFQIDGFGFRDRSWGPRFWQSFHWYKWLPVSFGPDFGVMLALMGQPDGPPIVNGHVFVDGELHPLVDASVVINWDENFYQQRLVANLRTVASEYVLEGEVMSLVPLRHRRTTPDGSEQTARITEAMTRYRCNGAEALGMSEFLDLMVDGQPISTRTAGAMA